MNKKLSIAMGLAMAGLSGLSSVASAEDNMGLEFSADVTMASDYLWRGVSISDEDPVIQGSFGVSHSSGIYAGVWASSLESVAGAETEFDLSLGWAGEFGPVGVDVAVVEYVYPGSSPSADGTEYILGLSGEAGPVGLGLTYVNGDSDFDWNRVELGAEYPISSVTLSATYAWNDRDSAIYTRGDYDDWTIGAATEFGGFGFSLTYADNDLDMPSSTEDSRFVFAISKSL
jgi:uncharacterized protein (TIGR02001 family)